MSGEKERKEGKWRESVCGWVERKRNIWNENIGGKEGGSKSKELEK